jgi:hypothetical protein
MKLNWLRITDFLFHNIGNNVDYLESTLSPIETYPFFMDEVGKLSGNFVFTSTREDTVTSTGRDATPVLLLLVSVTLRSLLDSLLLDLLIGLFIGLLHTDGKFTPHRLSGTICLFDVDSIEVRDDSDKQ